MAPASGANIEKASFTDLDGGGTFTVQFNPKEFKLDEKASWKASDEHGEDKPLLTYEKGEPTSISMELIFDCSDTMDNVNTKFIVPLRGFLTAIYEDTEVKDATGGGSNKRPCYTLFQWGDFTFDGVVEGVSATFLMFSTSGTPVRAKVNVTMKERARPDHAVAGGGGVTMAAGPIVIGPGGIGSVTGQLATYTVKDGETLPQVAANTGVESRLIAQANGLGDPLDLKPGTKLVITHDAKLAAVLAAQLLGSPPVRTSNPTPDPFDENRGFLRNDPGASAIDENAPVAMTYESEMGDFANAYISFGPEYEGNTPDSDMAIGTYGATGAGDGVGQHSQHGANPIGDGQRPDAQTFGGDEGGAAVGQYGATGAGDGVGQHAQHGANPVGNGTRPDGQSFGGDEGGAAVGQYGATGAGDGVGKHAQHGANPIGEGSRPEGQSFGGDEGGAAVGQYGASGAGDGEGRHSQGGANPIGDGTRPEGFEAKSMKGNAAIGEHGARGEGGGPAGHGSSGADPTEGGGARGDRAMNRDRDGDGVPDRRNVEGAGRQAASESGRPEGSNMGAGRAGVEGSLDIDKDKMREDNTEAEASGPKGDMRQARRDMGKKEMAQAVANKVEEKTGERPESMDEVKKAAKGMGLGEAMREAKKTSDENPSGE